MAGRARPLSAGALAAVVAGCAPAPPELDPPAPAPLEAELRFSSPFDGPARLVNYFDHDLPLQFADHNGVQRTFWGEGTVGIDGHSGYDWDLEVGTPLRAVADGKVVALGVEPPFYCPLLDRVVDDQRFVRVRHVGPDGVAFDVVYKHVSSVERAYDEVVRRGDVLARSGQTGCVSGAHLHFEVWRLTDTVSGRPARVDPYGWEGEGPDPWATHPDGAASVWLWGEGAAPPLLREVRRPANVGPGERAPVAIVALRWMGFRDDAHLDNEQVVLEADPRYAPDGYDLGGAVLINDRGERFRFPAGTVLGPGQRLTVVTGRSDDPQPNHLYWERATGAWDNRGDRARLLGPDGSLVYALW